MISAQSICVLISQKQPRISHLNECDKTFCHNPRCLDKKLKLIINQHAYNNRSQTRFYDKGICTYLLWNLFVVTINQYSKICCTAVQEQRDRLLSNEHDVSRLKATPVLCQNLKASRSVCGCGCVWISKCSLFENACNILNYAKMVEQSIMWHNWISELVLAHKIKGNQSSQLVGFLGALCRSVVGHDFT